MQPWESLVVHTDNCEEENFVVCGSLTSLPVCDCFDMTVNCMKNNTLSETFSLTLLQNQQQHRYKVSITFILTCVTMCSS